MDSFSYDWTSFMKSVLDVFEKDQVVNRYGRTISKLKQVKQFHFIEEIRH